MIRAPRLNLREKLMVIVGTTTISFLLMMAVGWLLNVEIERQAAVIRDRYIPLVELGYNLEAQFNGMGRGFLDAVSAQEIQGLAVSRELKDKMIAEINAAKNIVDPQQGEELTRAIETYFNSASAISERLIQNETGLSIVSAMTDMQAKRAEAETTMKRVITFDRRKLTEAFASISHAQSQNARIRVWVSFACVIVIFLVSFFMGRDLMRRLREIAKGLARFGEGDFREPIEVPGNDELAVLARQVNAMAGRIQSLLGEIESFSYTVAHDLRSPLRSILGFSSILIEDEGPRLTDEGRVNLGRVTTAAQRMSQMVDGLLKLSRMNRATVNRQEVNLSEIARHAVDELRAGEPGRTVVAEIEPDVEALGDPQLLDVVLANLIGNAWKFTGKTEGARIQFGRRMEDGKAVLFVSDNGAGFDMRFSDKLFGTFQRLHANGEFEGHGIGLATVKSIVQKHGGRIWAESAPGKGATFYFTLE